MMIIQISSPKSLPFLSPKYNTHFEVGLTTPAYLTPCHARNNLTVDASIPGSHSSLRLIQPVYSLFIIPSGGPCPKFGGGPEPGPGLGVGPLLKC